MKTRSTGARKWGAIPGATKEASTFFLLSGSLAERHFNARIKSWAQTLLIFCDQNLSLSSMKSMQHPQKLTDWILKSCVVSSTGGRYWRLASPGKERLQKRVVFVFAHSVDCFFKFESSFQCFLRNNLTSTCKGSRPQSLCVADVETAVGKLFTYPRVNFEQNMKTRNVHNVFRVLLTCINQDPWGIFPQASSEKQRRCQLSRMWKSLPNWHWILSGPWSVGPCWNLLELPKGVEDRTPFVSTTRDFLSHTCAHTKNQQHNLKMNKLTLRCYSYVEQNKALEVPQNN